MNQSQRPNGQPARILLATDLSARCDRAFDRAIQLAREWNAEIVLLTVLEQDLAPDEAQAWLASEEDTRERFVRRLLAQELEGIDVPMTVRIREGDVAEAIQEVAEATNSDLIVTGMARNEAFGRFWIGSTVGRLARSVAQPLLVVRLRPREAYSRVLVATDFSDSSRQALYLALRLFPDHELVLYHAFGFTKSSDDTWIRQEIEAGELATFLAESDLTKAERSRLRVVIDRDEVRMALPRYVKEQDIELVFLGTRGRSNLMDVLLGSSAQQLLEYLPCDTMLVRLPPASA